MPVQLLRGKTVQPEVSMKEYKSEAYEPLPNGVEEILKQIAAYAAGYSNQLKWNEKEKLKADLMNRSERWASITFGQDRAKSHAPGIHSDYANTISWFLQWRKNGRRFNVRSLYRTFHFN